MSNQEVIDAMVAAGHYPQSHEWGVETARTMDEDGFLRAPLIKVYEDEKGRWILTVFGEWFYQVPNVTEVPAAALEMLRAMDRGMRFSPEVIKKYGLIQLEPAEFE
jgi:hypothetical protein